LSRQSGPSCLAGLPPCASHPPSAWRPARLARCWPGGTTPRNLPRCWHGGTTPRNLPRCWHGGTTPRNLPRCWHGGTTPRTPPQARWSRLALPGIAAERDRVGRSASAASAPRSLQSLPPRSPLPSLADQPPCSGQSPADRASRPHCPAIAWQEAGPYRQNAALLAVRKAPALRFLAAGAPLPPPTLGGVGR